MEQIITQVYLALRAFLYFEFLCFIFGTTNLLENLMLAVLV